MGVGGGREEGGNDWNGGGIPAANRLMEPLAIEILAAKSS